MNESERLAREIADLLVRYGSGGAFVVPSVTAEGPLFARLHVIDAAAQRAYGVTVEEVLSSSQPAL